MLRLGTEAQRLKKKKLQLSNYLQSELNNVWVKIHTTL